MQEFILSLREITPQDDLAVGGKGTNLAELAKGLPVPAAFCLTTQAYSLHLAQGDTREHLKKLMDDLDSTNLAQLDAISNQIKKLILDLTIPKEVEQAIAYSYRLLQEGKPGCLVAVRSSATAEDREDASFAGQQESFLNVDGIKNVLEAVKKCWASLWTSQAIHYRTQKGYDQNKVEMAVIIQEMVKAEFAGVMFTANPVNNSRKEILIQAVPGLGEALVSGTVSGQTFVLSKEGLRILSKPEETPLMAEVAIRELALAGVKIEDYYGNSQDVEWAFYKGKFYFLQSRPITTLGDEPVKPLVWDELNPVQREIAHWVAERFPEPVYPLDGIVVKTYMMAYFRSMENFGLNVPDVDWGRVEKGIFPEYFEPPRINRSFKLFFNFFRLGKILGSNPVQEWELQQGKMLNILDRMRTLDIKIYPPNIVFEYLEDALADFYSFVIWRYDYFLQNRLPGDILNIMLKTFLGERAPKIQEDLLAGIPCITLEINAKLEDLAHKTINYPGVFEAIRDSEDLASLNLAKVPGGSEFLQELDAFLALYGDRETSMGLGGLANPTWKESPEVVLGIIKSLLTGDCGLDGAGAKALKRQQEAEAEVSKVFSRGIWVLTPFKSLVFALVKQNRSFAIFRENSHYHITKGINAVKRLFLELGYRLVKLDILDQEKDVVYLTYFEVKALVNRLYNYQSIDREEVKTLVEQRKREQKKRFSQWQTHKAFAQAPIKGGMRGSPASAGVAAGPARIIKDPSEFYRLQKGDILIAPYTNPAWTPLFASAAGVVVDTGGPASHAAVIAREYGIPAVMGVGNATELLADGEKIMVNGSAGHVLRDGNVDF